MGGPGNYAAILSSGYLQGRDFRVSFGDSKIEQCLLAAPHGGGIEPGTSEIMRATAETGGWAWYEFAGFLQRGNKDALHIASKQFDEPTLMTLLSQTGFVIAFHGASQETEPVVYVGGCWEYGRQVLIDSIQASAKAHGIRAVDAVQGSPAHLQGVEPANLANRGRRREGVQLEFSRGARNLLFPPDASREVRGRRSAGLRPLAKAIHGAIKQLTAMAAAK